MTIHWIAFEQYLTVVLFAFQFYPICNCGKCFCFVLGIARSERVRSALKLLCIPTNLTAKNESGTCAVCATRLDTCH